MFPALILVRQWFIATYATLNSLFTFTFTFTFSYLTSENAASVDFGQNTPMYALLHRIAHSKYWLSAYIVNTEQ